MKNILYLHAGAELYGSDIVLLELIKKLDKSKFTPYVILPSSGPLVDKLLENNISVKIIEYPILRRKYFTPMGIVKYIRNYFRYSKILVDEVKNRNIDIIHINTSAVLEGIYIKRKLRKPLLWHIHEIILKPKIISKILAFFISKSDKVVVVSNAVKKNLQDSKKNIKNIEVIYNGVDNLKFNKFNPNSYIRNEFKIPSDAIVVGMIGRVNSWKGQEDFLCAIEKVLNDRNDVYAMLIGGVFNGEEWRIEKLKEKIEEMSCKDRIVIDTYRTDIANVHSLYDVFVLPSINPDPLPTVVLEAMASNTPIIAYKHGGVCEMVKDGYNGALVDVRDVHQLGLAIESLVVNKELRIIMGENSLERQKKLFSMNSYIKNFERVYEEIK